jgi:hypothetical protein
VIETVIGVVSVRLALAETPPYVAVTVTGCVAAIIAGAVYSPLEEMLPTCGLRDQVTPLDTAEPSPLAVNCWLCPGCRVAADGLTETVGGTSCTAAEDVLLVSAPLVAVTVTDVGAGIDAGAV